MQWTNEQLNAIKAVNGTLLVSAAAGSGKTAVLVERVIRRLTSQVNPCGADSLLMVTFTKAAAAQMRERIGEALAKRIAENPKDARLIRQQMLLPFARICTIDSFCNELVRENFHLLDIGPDFKILDESEAAIMRRESAGAVVEALYEENAPETGELAELLMKNNTDSVLTESIIRLHNEAEAYPFPEEWLNGLLEPFEHPRAVEESVWGTLIRQYAADALTYCIAASTDALEAIRKDEIVWKAYTPTFEGDIAVYQKALTTVQNGSWDEMLDAVREIKFDRIGTLPRGFSSPVKDSAQALRGNLKPIAQKKLPDVLCANAAEHLEDMAYLKPVVSKLVQAVMMYTKEYAQRKTAANSADFADILHLALRLLVQKKPDGSVSKTPLAAELAGRYTEILVDEYQDINKAQDMIFTALSKEENNLFFVGDVKQSIYRFRQAMPEIFLSRRGRLPLYEEENYPARVVLGKNFRSRAGITGFVNFVFSQIMSKAVGELDYDKDEELVPAAEYPPARTPDAEIHIIDISDGVEDSKESTEARYIGQMIHDLIASGLTVNGKNGERPAEYRDFCVLMRSVKNKAAAYIEELSKQNIPAYTELSGGFFQAREVAFMLSLLRILDNPLQDVPLLAVMLSPVFGFTPDDLARLRINDRKASLYRCLLAARAMGDSKCADFLKQTEELRRLASTLAAGALVRHLLEETGYLAIAGAMDGGAQRRANLHLLLDYANKYEAAGHIGLSGFIRFIDKLTGSDGDLSPALELSEAANVVRVMSIHKSKGLEFPVCILAGCSTGFNKESLKGKIVINPLAGVGLCRRDIATFREFDTISRRGAILATEQSELSEELRVLYVALTRAKERLITVMSIKDPEKKLAALAGIAGNTAQIAPFAVRGAGSPADWILTAALRHPDAGLLRRLAGAEDLTTLPAGFALKTACRQEEMILEQDDSAGETAQPNTELLAVIEKRLSYRYPYAALSAVVAKRAASELEESGINRAFFAASRPAFLSQDKLTPAQRGTAIHKYMQYADYAAARADAAAERDRLIGRGFLTGLEGAAVDLDKINAFFQSDLAERIFASEKLMREQKFAIQIPARELYPELPENAADETVVVQGIADCAFIENGELVILDYKTDRGVTLEQLAERYAGQLAVYRRALTACLQMQVKESLLYSFEAGSSITV